MREARFLLVAGMIYALKGALSFAVRARFGTISRASSLATLRCAGSAAPSTTLTKPRPSSEDYRVLEELASRVVHGTTDKESFFLLALAVLWWRCRAQPVQ